MPFDPEVIRTFEHDRWERAAAAYGSTFATATAPFIDPLLDAAEGSPLLDIACGPGFVTSRAHARGVEARGIDFSSAMLAVARARAPGIGFDEGDAERLPYADGTFAAAVSNFGIHHVPRPLLALQEAYRVLCPGGRVAFSFWADPSENIAWKLVFDAVARHGDRAAGNLPAPGGGLNTPEQCAQALGEAGFADCTTRVVHATWQHRDAASLVATLRAGTARMAAMLEAQRPEAMTAIIGDISRHAEPYRSGEAIAVPIAAVIASGSKA